MEKKVVLKSFLKILHALASNKDLLISMWTKKRAQFLFSFISVEKSYVLEKNCCFSLCSICPICTISAFLVILSPFWISLHFKTLSECAKSPEHFSLNQSENPTMVIIFFHLLQKSRKMPKPFNGIYILRPFFWC